MLIHKKIKDIINCLKNTYHINNIFCNRASSNKLPEMWVSKVVCSYLCKLVSFASIKLYSLISFVSHIAQLYLTQVHNLFCFRIGLHIFYNYATPLSFTLLNVWRSISQNVASLNILGHDVVDLYYGHWTVKGNYLYVQLHSILKGTKSFN